MFTYQKIEFPLVFVKVLAETDERVEYQEKETSSLESYIASKELFFCQNGGDSSRLRLTLTF